MSALTSLSAPLYGALLVGLGLLLIVATVMGINRVRLAEDKRLGAQLLSALVILLIIIAVIVLLPLSDTTRGQILSLLGAVITGIIALSSTTFVANAMAGVMLRATSPFRVGDFIRVEGLFGRVTHRALMHTRVQTDTRDFTTLPNMLLVKQGVTVLHREGTIIQADLSLGYDVHHGEVEEQLKAAVAFAGLEDPYVLIIELLDHAIVYRAAGFLPDVKNPLSARSQLLAAILDHLHNANIEVASPSVVSQRRDTAEARWLPPKREVPSEPGTSAPEERIFDSAEAAALKQKHLDALQETRDALKAQQQLLKKLPAERRPAEEVTLQRLQQKLAWLEGQEDKD
jgi:small-conductance mechanosensitive channel